MKTWLEISASALRHNYQRVAEFIAPAQVMAVVKSDAYGHGLTLVGEVLKETATSFAVDRVEEGVALRRLGIEVPILGLGYTEPALHEQAIEARLTLTVSDLKQLEQLHFTTQEQQVSTLIHLELETGLYRQGIPEQDIQAVIELLNAAPWISVQGMFTHFANVEEDEKYTYPTRQVEAFKKLSQQFADQGIEAPMRHMACSAAALGFKDSLFDAVRLGIGLYGIWSSELTKTQAKKAGLALTDLKPVLTWKTVIAQVKDVAAGETIGYDCTETVTRPTRLAVLPIGYYDGFPRNASSRGIVLVNGMRCKVLGRVCMNMCMIDVTDAPGDITTGTEVVIIGPGIELEEACERAQTIHHDYLARLSSTIPRQLVD